MSGNGFCGTPFHKATAARSETTWWYGWGGYAVPDVYRNPWQELAAVRTGVSMNEMSPIPKLQISGPEAAQCVDYLVTRDTRRMEVGYAWYMPWCTEQGKVIADGIVFRFEENRFVFSGDRSISSFKAHAQAFNVEMSDVTDDYGILALQGPRSRAVLESVTGEAWADLAFCRIRRTRIAGAEVDVARQGFTGELGYELWVSRPDGNVVWEAVAAAGDEYGIMPAGEYAIDIARVEAGLILVSADYAGAGNDEQSADVVVPGDDHATPLELGLAHCISLQKPGDFVGRNALMAETEQGPRRRLVGIQIDLDALVELYMSSSCPPDISPRVRWDRLTLRHGGEAVGKATSITWSPTAGKMIGFARLPIELAEKDTRLILDWADFWGTPMGPVPAQIIDTPFIKTNRSI